MALLMVVGTSSAAMATPAPPQLVGSTSFHLPQTVEVLTARPYVYGTLFPLPQTVTLPPSFGGGTVPIITSSDGDAVPVRRTGPDASGRYHHFLRILAAPLGRQILELDARSAADGVGEKTDLSVTIAESRYHGLQLLPLQLTQEHVRVAFFLDAYTNTFSTTAAARWRTTITVEQQTAGRWQRIAGRDSGWQARNTDSENQHTSQPTLLPITSLMHRHGHFRLVVTETARAGRQHFRQRRTLDPWQPIPTSRYCLLLTGPARPFCVKR